MASLVHGGVRNHFLYRRHVYVSYICLCDGIGYPGHGRSLDIVWEDYNLIVDTDRRSGVCIHG